MWFRTQFLEPMAFAILAALVYAATHVANLWLFEYLSISSHIAWVYLPAFLRLTYALVLGPVWGFLGTFIGGALLIAYHGSGFELELPNVLISAASGSIAWGIFVLTTRTEFNFHRLWHWTQLTVYCSLVSVCLHHLYWFELDTAQIVDPSQIGIMFIGDLLGTLLGALLLKLGAAKWMRKPEA